MTRGGNARTAGVTLLVYIAAGIVGAVLAILFLRGRSIPPALAWIGVVASVLLLVGLPLQLGGVGAGAAAQAMWLPMLTFEVPLALWLIVKGC